MKGIAGDTARDVVAKLVSVAPDSAAVDAAVAAALKETPRRWSIFLDPEFWVAIVHSSRSSWLAYKPVMRSGRARSLDGRAAKIRAQIEEARKLREEAQALLSEYQRKQRDAMAEAEKIISQARTEAARLKGGGRKGPGVRPGAPQAAGPRPHQPEPKPKRWRK